MQWQQQRGQRGFTLVEVLIVAVIIAVLIGIAYPFYAQYQMRAERSDATLSLLQGWTSLERCFIEELDYADCADRVPSHSQRGHYVIDAELQPGSFRLTATPVAGGPQEADEPCQVIAINHRGERSSEPSAADTCWGR